MINLKNIEVKFGDFKALSNINLEVKEGEFFTFLGPSGCGKTTTLRTIVGFIQPSSGTVSVNGIDITNDPIEKRNIGIVFQSYALFPTLNVYENIAFGLKVKKLPKKEIDERVRNIAKKVDLNDEQLMKKVSELSGGQQQRVAIARALVLQPGILCLDEPLSNLDAKLRVQLRNELKELQKKFGITTIYVTHDQEEALTMSDTIAIMNEGRVQQIGTPVDIYNEPENAFVADFIGESNILSGTMIKDYLVKFQNVEFDCVDAGFGENTPVDIVIRPEDMMIVKADQGMLQGTVESVTFKGVHYEMIINSNDYKWMVHSTSMAPVGATVGMSLTPEAIHIMKRG